MWDGASGKSEQRAAEVYVKTMRRIVEQGASFVETESKRVRGLLAGKLSKDKETEMSNRLNVLQSFQVHDEL